MSLNRSRTLCRYYMQGICRFGEYCRFSHDVDARPSEEEKEDEQVATTSGYSRQRMWANAPVFVPSARKLNPAAAESPKEFCPRGGRCTLGNKCPHRIHLELCEMCQLYCLHPDDLEQRREHNRECLEQHEQDMELSFAIARSKDKMCGICFDTVVEKEGRKERRFGILSKCNHTFCLDCIRRWRQDKQFENTVTRACPECRVASDFVCPSAFWVDTKEEKDKLLTDYRTALGAKNCKYFRLGRGRCPFGNKCFYRHALPDGTVIDVGQPRRYRKPHRDSRQDRDRNRDWDRDDLMDFLDYYPWRMEDQLDQYWLDLYSSDFNDFSDGSGEDN